MGRFREVDPKRPVNDAENAVLQYWRDNDIPTKSITEREGSPEWIFYEVAYGNGRPGIHMSFPGESRTSPAATRPAGLSGPPEGGLG